MYYDSFIKSPNILHYCLHVVGVRPIFVLMSETVTSKQASYLPSSSTFTPTVSILKIGCYFPVLMTKQ